MIGSEIRLATFLRIAHPSFTYLYTSPYSTYSVYILAVHKLLFNQLLGYRSSPRRNIYPYHRRPLSMIIVFIHRIYLFENTIIHMYLNIRGNMTKTQIKRLTWTVSFLLFSRFAKESLRNLIWNFKIRNHVWKDSSKIKELVNYLYHLSSLLHIDLMVTVLYLARVYTELLREVSAVRSNAFRKCVF